MKCIQLTIQALSGLAIAQQKPGGSISEAENYIPGVVIRGAIAEKILRFTPYKNNDLTQNGGDFQALFLGENAAIFQNAYPAVIEGEKGIEIQKNVRVLPATALSSKTNPGFKTSKKSKDKQSGVFDTLIDRFCAESYGIVYNPSSPIDRTDETDETDGGRVEAYGGFYSQFNGTYYSHSVEKRLLTRVGINRRRATAEEEILYSLEVINESTSKEAKQNPVIFTGAILVTDILADSLTQFINHHCEGFRLGGATSRGLGKVKMEAKVEDIQPKVEEKIKNFNHTLQTRWQKWGIFGKPLKDLEDNRTYFTLDLQSDTILTEQWRRTTVISEAMLQQFAGVKDSSLRLESAHSSYSYRSGWNSAWGLMKDMELVTNKGAAYLYSTTQEQDWIKALEQLEIKGVGERTSEGFGQVKVCNEFHLVFWEDAV